MSFIKTFEQFKTGPINEAGFSGNITRIQEKPGEIARWKVVLRNKDKDTISSKNPSATLLGELSRNGEFKNWWSTVRIEGFPVQKSLAIVYSGVSNKTNLFGKEVAKAEIAFLKYMEDARGVVAPNGEPAAIVYYDVTKAEPVAEVDVEGAGVKLMAWHEEDLSKMKINFEPGFIQAKDKQGKLIPIDLVNPPYMYQNGLTVGAKPADADSSTQAGEQGADKKDQTQAPDLLGGLAPTGASAEMIAVTDKFIGLKMNNVFNQLAKDLQEIIIKNGSGARPTDANLLKDYDTRVSAATKIRTDGGADGLYGNATATSIGVLIGTNQAVAEVTKEVADKLAASFTGITPADAASMIGTAKSSSGTKVSGSGTGAGTKPKPRP